MTSNTKKSESKVLRLLDKSGKPPFEIREIWRDPDKEEIYFYQLFRNQWEICGWLADDCYKVLAIASNELGANTIIEALELLAEKDSKK